MQRAGTIIDIYDIVSSTVSNENQSILHNLGTAGTKTPLYFNNQLWAIVGISSIPVSPDSNGAAQSISINRSDMDIIFATRDIRFQSFISDIQEGDLYLYATGSNANAGIKVKADNTITTSSDTTNINANDQVNITAPMTQIGDSSAQPVTPAPWSQELLLLLTTFFTAMEGDPLLPLLLPSTYSAVQTLVGQLPLLLDGSVAPNPVPGGTQKMKAT